MARDTFPGRGKALNAIAARLRSAGYEKRFLERLIPGWWSQEAEANPSALAELKVILANRLGLDVGAMLSKESPEPTAPAGMRFKRPVDVQAEAPPDAALAFCAAVGRYVAAAMPSDLPPVASTGDAIRDEILSGASVQFVSLTNLLEYCWSHGVGVVHLPELPLRKKVDALVGRFGEHFAILLARDVKTHAWAAFHVAHELGHIALGHVTETDAIVDSDSLLEGERSLTEQKADKFALDTLGGSGLQDFWSRYDETAQALTQAVRERAPRHRVDPEHVLLRYGFQHDAFPFAKLALKYITTGRASGDIVNEVAARRLTEAELGDEGYDLMNAVLRVA